MKLKKIVLIIGLIIIASILILGVVVVFKYPLLVKRVLYNPQPSPSTVPTFSHTEWLMFENPDFDFQFYYPQYLEAKGKLSPSSPNINIMKGLKSIQLINDPTKLLIQDASPCVQNPKGYYVVTQREKVESEKNQTLIGLVKRQNYDPQLPVYSFKVDGRDAIRVGAHINIDNTDSYISIYSCKYSEELDQILSSFKFTK